MRPRFENKRDYNEIWSYILAFSSDLQLHLNLTRINHGGDNKTGADLSFINFKGGNHFVTCEYPAAEYFSYEAMANEFKLEFHKNITVKGNSKEQRIMFFREKNGTRYFLDVTVSDMAPSLVPEEHEVELKSVNTMGMLIQFPRAKVTGKVAINDDTLDVTGQAYSDHSYQSQLPTEFVDRGLRFFQTGDGPIQAGMIVKANKKNRRTLVGYALRGTKDSLELLNPEGLTGNSLEVVLANDERIKLEGFREYQNWGFLDELGAAGGALGFFRKDIRNSRGLARSGSTVYAVNRLSVK